MESCLFCSDVHFSIKYLSRYAFDCLKFHKLSDCFNGLWEHVAIWWQNMELNERTLLRYIISGFTYIPKNSFVWLNDSCTKTDVFEKMFVFLFCYRILDFMFAFWLIYVPKRMFLQKCLYMYSYSVVSYFLAQCRVSLGMQSGKILEDAITSSSSYDLASVGPKNAR